MQSGVYAGCPAKHRLTDIGKIPAHAAQPDIYGAV